MIEISIAVSVPSTSQNRPVAEVLAWLVLSLQQNPLDDMVVHSIEVREADA